MAQYTREGFSDRGWANIAGIMPKISAAVEARKQSTDAIIDLATAENWLLRTELIEMCKSAISTRLEAKHLSYPSAFGGDADALEAFAYFFNTFFHPHTPVETSHLATAPGAASCLDAILYSICDPGDGILVPGPYWNAFDFLIQSRCSVKSVAVTLPDLQSTLTEALLPALERAFESAASPIKALLLSNPNNPLAQCYPRSVLEGCLQFCQRRKIHFISDEIYALTSYDCDGLDGSTSFISTLSLDLPSLGCDPSRVHTFWSTSKDFGQSGIRMGCTVTQANKEMVASLVLASNTQTSSLSAICVSALLTSAKLPALIALNSERLATNCRILTKFLTRHKIPYIPSYAGLYVFARIAQDARSWEDEQASVQRFKDVGVLLSGGRGYHCSENQMGWMRVGFAVKKSRLEEALRRVESILRVEGCSRNSLGSPDDTTRY